ncbi:MAG: dihydroneopterin aldolase [Microthrixaceae bacterium]
MSEDLNSSDRIILRDLRLAGVVGVLPEERVRPQPLSIDIEILTDLTRAGLSDDLDDSVDYGRCVSRWPTWSMRKHRFCSNVWRICLQTTCSLSFP